MHITLIEVISWAAMLAIGFFAGMSYSKSKFLPRINRLRKKIEDLQVPDQNETIKPVQK